MRIDVKGQTLREVEIGQHRVTGRERDGHAMSFFQAQAGKSSQKHVVDPALQPWVEK